MNVDTFGKVPEENELAVAEARTVVLLAMEKEEDPVALDRLEKVLSLMGQFSQTLQSCPRIERGAVCEPISMTALKCPLHGREGITNLFSSFDPYLYDYTGEVPPPDSLNESMYLTDTSVLHNLH